MRVFRLVATLSCCAILFALLNSPVGGYPPLGRFLNPFTGFWANNRAQDVLPQVLELPGLIDPVEVRWDKRRVPHIIAQNHHDLFMAQGYIVARERLWQMDFQSRAAAGRLAEILGPRALDHDRLRRRIGLVQAAARTVELTLEHPESRLAVVAFSEGVNAWISSLSASSMPLEYKILDYEPEQWSPLKSALLLKAMAYTLSFRNSELSMTRTAEFLERDMMDRLYPEQIPCPYPAVPPGTRWSPPRQREDHPGRSPQSMTLRGWPVRPEAYDPQPPPDPELAGSNAWAVSGSKTASGFPILCSDPHLALTLPSIWYELQLLAPGFNTYGVTIPGSPGIIIGFNQDLAWGMTNAGSDVLDWYQLTYRDSTAQEYQYGAEWRPISRRVERIGVRGSHAVVDTVLETHYGPIVCRGSEKALSATIPPDAALRWTALDGSNEMLAFLNINTATTKEEFLSAVERYDAPAQNFVFADAAGDIGVIHAGKFPLRRRGQGRFLSDGANPHDEWGGWVAREYLPRAVNPPAGFVCSANQPPTDARYPYYLGSEYASADRATRIHDVLEKLDDVTPEMMISLQNDTYSEQAHVLLPLLVPILGGCALRDGERAILDELETWNGEYQRELYGPTIFEQWWAELYRTIWWNVIDRDSLTLRWPRRDVTTAMIADGSITRVMHTRAQADGDAWETAVCSSFHRACTALESRLGPLGTEWQWGFSRSTSIPHLAHLSGLGRSQLKTSGTGDVVNATTASAGPSWRMVVALGPDLRAWGIYPGGQSGNPGSDAYDGFVSDWVRGFTYELCFLRSASDSLAEDMQRTELRRSP